MAQNQRVSFRGPLWLCFLICAVVGIGAVGCQYLSPPPNEAPKPPENAVQFKDQVPVVRSGLLYGPTFVLKSGETSGGVMFAATLPGTSQPVLISAMHLFGPATGMEQQLTVDEISNQWASVTGTDLVDQKETKFSGVALGVPGASADFMRSISGDVVAFFPDSHADLQPIPLSPTDPKEGDVLWLLSHTLTNDSLTHRAVCQGMARESFITYAFDEPLQIAGTSGAPIINEQGVVVAVHRGGGVQNGKTVGVGSRASRFLPIVTGNKPAPK